jgi:hypothetical protein
MLLGLISIQLLVGHLATRERGIGHDISEVDMLGSVFELDLSDENCGF